MPVLAREQVLPHAPEEVFPFFADAHNLNRITPPWLRFRIVTPGEITMAPGTIIEYRLRLRGVPIRWRTRITEWQPPHRFVDEQVSGPYRRWRHEHSFEPDPHGTRARDRVEYDVAGGRIVDRLVVRDDLRRIFDYRAEQLEAIFGRPTRAGDVPPPAPPPDPRTPG
jgi:ligand-binding SRPBCC domain-containing protein